MMPEGADFFGLPNRFWSTPPVRGIQGRRATPGGDSVPGFPPEGKRSAQCCRREGVRDWSRMAVTAKSARGAARKARRCDAPTRPAVLAASVPTHTEATRYGAAQAMVLPPYSAAKAALRPAAWGGRGGGHAAWSLLRDQIRSCVPFSPSIRRA